MSYPKITLEEKEKLKQYVGRKITLLEYTCAHTNPKFRQGSECAASFYDQKQPGAHPDIIPESSRKIKTTLVTVLGDVRGDGIFPAYIIGKNKELEIYPKHTDLCSWIISVSGNNEILWHPGGSYVTDKIEKIREISAEEFEKLKQRFVQIV